MLHHQLFGNNKVLNRLFGNKWTTWLGVAIACLGIIDANDVLPPAWDDMLEGAMAFITGTGLMFAKDAATGSAPKKS